VSATAVTTAAAGMSTAAATHMSTTAATAYMGSAATAAMRSRGAGCAMRSRSATTDRTAAATHSRSTTAAHSLSACKMTAIGHGSAAAAIVSATTVTEAMTAPAVAVAPSGPWAHAQEDAVVKVPWPVKAHGCTRIRLIVVIAIGANGLNSHVHINLSLRLGRQGQACEHCCRTDPYLESAHMCPPLRCLRFLELRGMLCCRQEESGNRNHHKDSNPLVNVPHNLGGACLSILTSLKLVVLFVRV